MDKIKEIHSWRNCVLFFCLITMDLICLAQAEERNIGQKTYGFYDEIRNREIKTEIWYPTYDSIKPGDKMFSPFVREYTVRNGKLIPGNYPLIMVSHGSGGGRLTLEWIAQGLVNAGYVVAAVDHWGNTHDNPIAIEFIKPWERPQDISYALTKILSEEYFKNSIDTNAIGALGYSFGGYTVIALAGGVLDYPRVIDYYTTVGKKEASTPHFPELWKLLLDKDFVEQTRHIPNLKDDRINAFFAICPGTGPGFVGKNQFKDVKGENIFIVGVAGDNVAPVKGYARNYHQLITNSQYFEFSGKAGHYVMLGEGNAEIKREVPEAFTDDASVDRHQVHRETEELALRFFNGKLGK